jgi:hypothetical protein
MLRYYCSQGAAVMHSAVATLPDEVKKATIGGVLFGSTKNKQEDAKIRDYPKNQVMSFCVEDDGVCWGRLEVTGGEFERETGFILIFLTSSDEYRNRAFGVSYQRGRRKGSELLAGKN